jgi:hypothetical protein
MNRDVTGSLSQPKGPRHSRRCNEFSGTPVTFRNRPPRDKDIESFRVPGQMAGSMMCFRVRLRPTSLGRTDPFFAKALNRFRIEITNHLRKSLTQITPLIELIKADCYIDVEHFESRLPPFSPIFRDSPSFLQQLKFTKTLLQLSGYLVLLLIRNKKY